MHSDNYTTAQRDRTRTGATSWRGYLASTGRRDHSEDKEKLSSIRKSLPQTLNEQRSAIRQECMLATDPDVFAAFGKRLWDIGDMSLEQQVAGWTALREALQAGALDVDAMENAFRAGVAGA